MGSPVGSSARLSMHCAHLIFFCGFGNWAAKDLKVLSSAQGFADGIPSGKDFGEMRIEKSVRWLTDEARASCWDGVAVQTPFLRVIS